MSKIFEDSGNLKLLRTLLVLGECRSVSKAASRLHVSQPTVSQSLSRLRTIFNDPLFIRTGGLMMPTSRCSELQEQIADLLSRFEQLSAPRRSFDPAKTRTTFRIMAAEFASEIIGPALIKRIAQESDITEIEFHSPDANKASGMLGQGTIDFRLGWWPDPAPTLKNKVLWTDRLCCILRPEHPLLRRKLTSERYFAARHVRVHLPAISHSMSRIDRAAAKSRRVIDVAAWVHNAHAMANVVAATNLVGTLSEKLADQLSEGQVKRHDLPLAGPAMRVALYWHERTHVSPAHMWFRSMMGRAVGDLL